MRKYKGLVLSILATSIILTGCNQGEKGVFSSDKKISKEETIQLVKDNLKKNDIEIEIVKLEETEIPSLYKMTAKNHPDAYVSKDGKYIVGSPVLNVSEKGIYEIGEKLQNEKNKTLISQVNKDEAITYPAIGETKHSIYVFTDVACAYCKQLHQIVPELNKAGIEVNYLAFPRSEEFKPAMEQVWCSKDKKTAYETAIKDGKVESEKCENPVSKHFELGTEMGIRGTPGIVSSEGVRIGGFMSPEDLVQRLDAIKNPEKAKEQEKNKEQNTPASEPKAE